MFHIEAAEAEGQPCISKQENPKGSDHPEPYKLQELVHLLSVADMVAVVQMEEAGGQ
jgi:hypothetical protein